MFDAEDSEQPEGTAGELAVTCVDAAHAAVSVAAGMPVHAPDGARLRELTLQLEALRRFVDATEAHALAELDAREVTDTSAGHRTSQWLAHHAGLPSGVARQRLVVANRLAAMLPEVDDALTSGMIGFDHARVFADVVNEGNHEASEPSVGDLIGAASGTVFSRWRANVSALAALLDPDGGHDPSEDVTANRLTLSPSNGFMLIRAELTDETALSVHDTLKAIADELFHQHVRDRDQFPDAVIPPRATLLALALEEICRRALAIDRHSTRPPRVEATIILNQSKPTGPTHDVFGVSVVSVVRDLVGSPLPAATLRTFLCDPVLHAALLDSLGLPVDMGRATRTVTPAQRRALVLRDSGCTFPGCDCPAAWADAHDVRHWRHGGPTDLSNLTSTMYVPMRRRPRPGHGDDGELPRVRLSGLATADHGGLSGGFARSAGWSVRWRFGRRVAPMGRVCL